MAAPRLAGGEDSRRMALEGGGGGRGAGYGPGGCPGGLGGGAGGSWVGGWWGGQFGLVPFLRERKEGNGVWKESSRGGGGGCRGGGGWERGGIAGKKMRSGFTF